MNKKPKCALCEKDGFVQLYGRFVCGDCLCAMYAEKAKQMWGDVDKNETNYG